MTGQPSSERTQILRNAKRADYERATVDAILDAAPVCHVGFVRDGQPAMIPTIGARVSDSLYLHGAAGNAMLRAIEGEPCCITATLIDGLVLARSVFHHSMNYRSAVIYGVGTGVVDRDEKLTAFAALTEKIAPGQWAHARQPNDKEIDITRVVKVPISEFSAKIRTGPPVDDADDYQLGIWAGVVPLRVVADAPVPDAEAAGLPTPDHIMDLVAD